MKESCLNKLQKAGKMSLETAAAWSGVGEVSEAFQEVGCHKDEWQRKGEVGLVEIQQVRKVFQPVSESTWLSLCSNKTKRN